MTRPTDDLLASLGPHLIAPEERAWARSLAGLLVDCQQSMAGGARSLDIAVRAGIPELTSDVLRQFAGSAHASMRLRALLPLPAPIAEVHAFAPGSIADCAFTLVVAIPADHRSTQRSLLESDDAEQLAGHLAALRCAERLGLWPERLPAPADEGAAWVAKASFRRCAFGDPAGGTVAGVFPVRDAASTPDLAVAWAIAFPAILRLSGIPGSTRLDELHRDHARDRQAIGAATAHIRTIAERL